MNHQGSARRNKVRFIKARICWQPTIVSNFSLDNQDDIMKNTIHFNYLCHEKKR